MRVTLLAVSLVSTYVGKCLVSLLKRLNLRCLPLAARVPERMMFLSFCQFLRARLSYYLI